MKGRWRKVKRKKRREEDDKKGRHGTRRNLVGVTESHKWLCSVNCADRESRVLSMGSSREGANLNLRGRVSKSDPVEE